MKISKLLFASALIASSLILGSCGDDDESPSYEQSEFIGNWELTASTNSEFEECSNVVRTLTVSETQLSIPTYQCSSSRMSTAYTFNGKAFVADFGGISFDIEIKSKSDTQFTWEYAGEVDTYTKLN